MIAEVGAEDAQRVPYRQAQIGGNDCLNSFFCVNPEYAHHYRRSPAGGDDVLCHVPHVSDVGVSRRNYLSSKVVWAMSATPRFSNMFQAGPSCHDSGHCAQSRYTFLSSGSRHSSALAVVEWSFAVCSSVQGDD